MDSSGRRNMPGLNINTTVSIAIGDRVYPSMVQELDDSGIWLAMPLSRRSVVKPRRGQPLAVSYWSDRGRWTFTSSVLRTRLGDLPMIQVAWPDDYDRTQQRRTFRLVVSVRLRWRAEGYEDWEETHTRDLSAGGVLATGRPPGWTGEPVEVELILPTCVIQALGRVVRSEEEATAVEFTRISGTDVDALVAFLFEEQRRRRKLGLV